MQPHLDVMVVFPESTVWTNASELGYAKATTIKFLMTLKLLHEKTKWNISASVKVWLQEHDYTNCEYDAIASLVRPYFKIILYDVNTNTTNNITTIENIYI